MPEPKKHQPNRGIKPLIKGFKGNPSHIVVPGGARVHTKITPAIREIAARFSGNNATTVKHIADFVFRSTYVKQTVFDSRRRYRRSAEDVLKQQEVDLLHCHDRGHALISVLTAKKIPAWMVISIDYQKFVHSYVEAMVGNKIYTIAFKTSEPPIFAEGKCEDVIRHAHGASFVRGRELADFGVKNKRTFDKFAEELFAGKVKNKINIEP